LIKIILSFLDQELISYCYSSCSSSFWGDRLQKSHDQLCRNELYY